MRTYIKNLMNMGLREYTRVPRHNLAIHWVYKDAILVTASSNLNMSEAQNGICCDVAQARDPCFVCNRMSRMSYGCPDARISVQDYAYRVPVPGNPGYLNVRSNLALCQVRLVRLKSPFCLSCLRPVRCA